MKKIGVIGGAAWPSTLEYYRLICEAANAHFAASGAAPPYPTPPMIIESLNIAETRALRGRPGDEASWAAYDVVIRAALLRLEAAGCDFAIMANNTFHTRLD
ncbi:MAG: Asp/Glu racemase, partial [Pseudomonadota bacterium]